MAQTPTLSEPTEAAKLTLRVGKDARRYLDWRDTAAATSQRQAQQATDMFKLRRRIRSGIEGTNSTLKRRYGLLKVRARARARG